MSRSTRVRVKGVWYHVTNRGVNRERLFVGVGDQEKFTEFLSKLPERYGFRIHGYVLMGNHYHLLIEDPELRISEGMKWLNLCYGMSFNRRHRRVGPVFQGRFKGVILDPEERGLSVSRYVHLNPIRVKSLGLNKQVSKAIRAGKKTGEEVVKERLEVLQDYPWSSYRAYVGLDRTPKWLTSEFVLKKAGGKREYRQQVEKEIREGKEESLWEEVKWGLVLGGEVVEKRVRKVIAGDREEQKAIREMEEGWNWDEVVKKVEEKKGEEWTEFSQRHGDWGRDLVLLLMRERGRMGLKQMAEKVGMTGERAISTALRRLRKKMEKDDGLRKIYEQLKSH